MQSYHTNDISALIQTVRAGDRILLSGIVYTARDAAHKRISTSIEQGKPLPFPLENAVIYYAGPTPTPPHLSIGSCGPTTSSRMDSFTPQLMELGVKATIGKGKRSQEVINALQQYQGVYLAALGGAGALAASRVESCEVIAYEDLGCESVKKLVLKDFPLIVGADCYGNVFFQ